MENSPVPQGKVKFVAAGTTFIVDERYEFIKKIGHGAYGIVVSAYDRKRTLELLSKKCPGPSMT
jgi:mitogen-activated protein kinase 1/3